MFPRGKVCPFRKDGSYEGCPITRPYNNSTREITVLALITPIRRTARACGLAQRMDSSPDFPPVFAKADIKPRKCHGALIQGNMNRRAISYNFHLTGVMQMLVKRPIGERNGDAFRFH